MLDRVFTIVGSALMLAIVTGPAFAGITPAPLPEPASITLVGLGIVGAIVARKYLGRK